MLLKAGSGLHYSCNPNFFNQLMSLGRFEVFIITAEGLEEGGGGKTMKLCFIC